MSESLRDLLRPAIEAFERLSRRDRLTLIVAALAAVALLVLAVVYSISSAQTRRERRIESLKGQIAQVMGRKDNYVRAKARLEGFHEKLRANKLNPGRLIAQVAEKMKLSPSRTEDVSPRAGLSGELQEIVFRAEFNRVPFPALFDFLRDIEATHELVYIRNLELHRRFDNVDQVDVTVQVATLTMVP